MPAGRDEGSDVSFERITDDRDDFQQQIDTAYENYWIDETSQGPPEWGERHRTVSDIDGGNYVEHPGRAYQQPARPRGWQGPTNWKEVDLDELSTTARSLIKSITATTAEDVAEDERSKMPVISLEKELQDPLGMGMIDLNTMRLEKAGFGMDHTGGLKNLTGNATAMGRFMGQLASQHPMHASLGPPASSHGNPFLDPPTGGTGKAKTRKNVPVAKVLPMKEGFDPELYLQVFHETTSMSDLQRGMHLLSKDLSEQTGQLKQLIKSNFERFISCKDTIDDIHIKLRMLESEKKSGSSQALQEALTQVATSSRKVFGPALDRHSKAERIKSVMNLLRRFSTLFNTPKRITQHAAAGDYEQIITEYRKTNALIRPGPHTPRIWITLYKEIQRRVVDVLHEMVDALAEPLLPPTITPDLIRYIIALQVEGLAAAKQLSPVNVYIHHVETHFIKVIKEVEQQHDEEMSRLRELYRRSRPTKEKLSSPKHGDIKDAIDMADLLLWHPDDEDGEASSQKPPEQQHMVTSSWQKGLALKSWINKRTEPTPAQVAWLRYLVQMSALLTHTIPNFWQVLSSKKLTNLNDVANDDIRASVEAQAAQGPKVLQRIMSSYCNKVSGVMGVLAKAGALQRVQQAAIAELAGVYTQLTAKRAPALCTTAVQGVLATTLKSFVQILCGHLDQVVVQLWEKETWLINLTQQDRDPVTQFPELLREEVGVVMLSYKTMMASCNKAGGVPDDMSWQPLNEHFFQIFDQYVSCVTEAAAEIMGGKAEAPKAKSSAPSAATPAAAASSPAAAMPADMKLLLLNSNTRSLQQGLVSHLVHTYIHLLAPGPTSYAAALNSMGIVQFRLEALAGQLEQQFVQRKKGLLDKVLRSYMAAAAPGTPFPSRDVTEISDTGRDLLHSLVMIQSEVFSYTPSLTGRIMPTLLLYVMNELSNLFTGMSRDVPVERLVQFYVDLDALQGLLPKFLDADFKGAILTCQGVLCNRAFEAMKPRQGPEGSAPHTAVSSLVGAADARDLSRRMRKACRKIVQPQLEHMAANFRCFQAGKA